MPKPHIPFEGPTVSPLSDDEIRALGRTTFEALTRPEDNRYDHPADFLMDASTYAERLGLRFIKENWKEDGLWVEARSADEVTIYRASRLLPTDMQNVSNMLSISAYLLHVAPFLRDGVGIQIVKGDDHPHAQTGELLRQAHILANELIFPAALMRQIWGRHKADQARFFFRPLATSEKIDRRAQELGLEVPVQA